MTDLQAMAEQFQSRNVLLFFPHNGTIRTEFALSAFKALTNPDSPIAEMREIQSGPLIGIARNMIAEHFLATDHEWLLMADSDMVFTPGTVRTLLNAADPEERPIVGGLCWMLRPEGRVPTMHTACKTEDGKFGFTARDAATVPRSELVKVDATGCGFLLIHRSVFGRISESDPESDRMWFAELPVDGELYGEDFSFCIRAATAKIPVYVHTGARTGHVKTVVLGDPGP